MSAGSAEASGDGAGGQAGSLEGDLVVCGRGDCAFEALLFATGRTDLTVEGLRQAAVKKVQGRADLSSAAVPNFGVWQRLMTSGDRGDQRTWADAIAVAGAGEALEGICGHPQRVRPALL